VRELHADSFRGRGGRARRPSGRGLSAASPHEIPGEPDRVAADFLAGLTELHSALRSFEVRSQLARLVSQEEQAYRAGRKNNYYADVLGIDVLTDTTERSPTYCTPPFRKFGDLAAEESWSFLFLPDAETAAAWERILKRKPHCLSWSEGDVRRLVGPEETARCCETLRRVSCPELMRFRIGLDGLPARRLGAGDSAVGILADAESASLFSPAGFHRRQLETAGRAGANIGLLFFARRGGRDGDRPGRLSPEADSSREHDVQFEKFVAQWNPGCVAVVIPVRPTDFLLDGLTRVAAKMVLNALSTCTMVRLGRVLGNTMIWVVPSNLKLIDRATRYVRQLTGLSYESANRLLFEVIEYVEPRMKSDRAYPPVVGLAALRARHQLTNREAEERFLRQE
jgi:N-acetylmuramic acid 6-phosphate etherase